MTAHRCLIAAALLVLLIAVASASEDDAARKERFARNKVLCAKIVRSSTEDKDRYSRSEYPETHDTACFFRCVAILNGSYDDESGVNMELMHELFGSGMSAEEYAEESKDCLAKRDEVECYCMKAYKPLMCMREQFKNRNTL